MTLGGGYKLEMTLEQPKQAFCFLENEFLCDVKQHRASSVNTWRIIAFNHSKLLTLATVGFKPHHEGTQEALPVTITLTLLS